MHRRALALRLAMALLAPFAAAPAAVAAALRAELREWRESVLPAALRDAGVLQVTGTVDERSFVLRYDAMAVRGRPLDDVELRGQLIAAPTGGTRVAATLRHDDGLGTLALVWMVVLVAIGWFSLAGAFVVLVFGSALMLHAWWYAQRASRLVALQRHYLVERLEHALRVAEQQPDARRETAG